MKSRVTEGLSWILATLLLATGCWIAIDFGPSLVLARRGQDYLALTPENKLEAQATLRTSMLQAIAGAVVLVGAMATLRQYFLAKRQAAISRRAQILEIYSKSLDQLAAPLDHIRLGGVQVLSGLHGTAELTGLDVIRLLSHYVRVMANDRAAKTSTDAALASICSLSAGPDQVDLGRCTLIDRDFSSKCIKFISFKDSELQGSSFRNAKIMNTDFTNADLYAADFSGAQGDFDLQNARRISKAIGTDGGN